MPTEAVQSVSPAAAVASSANGAPELPLGTIEARVAAILEDGRARLATAFGFLDVPASPDLAVGARAQLLVENTGVRVLLTQLASSDAATARQVFQTSVSNAATRTSGGSTPTPLDQPETTTLVPLRPGDTIPPAIAAAARAATATQQSPAALLAHLLPALSDTAGGLPPDVQRAAAQVLAQAVRADRPLDAAALQAAVRQSGLFREARGTAQTGPDWKQALVDLKAALTAWSPPASASPSLPQPSQPGAFFAPAAPADGDQLLQPTATGTVPSGAAPDTPAPAAIPTVAAGRQNAPGLPATPAAAPAPAGPDAGQPGAIGHGQPPATQPPPTARAAPMAADAPASARPTQGETTHPASVATDRPFSLLAGQEVDTPSTAGSALLRELVSRVLGVALAPQDSAVSVPQDGEPALDRHAPDRPAPPRADVPPRTLPPQMALEGDRDVSGQQQRDALMEATDGALDRVRLNQFASLPRESTAPPQQGLPNAPATHPPTWVFDVPVLLGREAAVAQFRVTRDGKSAAAEGVAPRWSVDLAIDTGETGPVHARVSLGGAGVGVTLWAERPDTADQLRAELPGLRKTLDAAAFEVEELAVLHGAPRAPQPRTSGYFLDTQS